MTDVPGDVPPSLGSAERTVVNVLHDVGIGSYSRVCFEVDGGDGPQSKTFGDDVGHDRNVVRVRIEHHSPGLRRGQLIGQGGCPAWVAKAGPPGQSVLCE